MWLDMTSSEDEDLNAWCEAGYDLVARGQVAVLLIAGGGRRGGGGKQHLTDGGEGGRQSTPEQHCVLCIGILLDSWNPPPIPRMVAFGQ